MGILLARRRNGLCLVLAWVCLCVGLLVARTGAQLAPGSAPAGSPTAPAAEGGQTSRTPFDDPGGDSQKSPPQTVFSPQFSAADSGGALLIGGPPVLDGNLSDFKALVDFVNSQDIIGCAVNQLDNINNGVPVGLDGFQDEPIESDATPQGRFMHSPINVGNFIFIYIPDSDGVIDPPTEDDSFLGVGVNIANGDGDVTDDTNKLLTSPDLPENIMVPFDSDGNGDPCMLGQGCAPGDLTPSRWCPQNPVLTYDEAIEGITLSFKLCATGPGSLTMPEFEIQYLQRLGNATSIVMTEGFDDTQINAFPSEGTSCEDIRIRGLDGNTAYPDGLGNDDIELVVTRIDSQVAGLFPGEDFQRITRYRLASLGMTLRSDSTGDLSNEDSMFTLCQLDIPEIEVTKQIRCEGDGDDEWRASADATVGSTLEFRIEVENVGNVPLAVTLTDTLQALTTAGITLDVNSLMATLHRPSDGPGVAVDNTNAAMFGLNPIFFTPTPQGFLAGAAAGEARFLGVLNATDVCSDPMLPQLGDRVVLRFAGTVSAPSNFCGQPPAAVDLRNSITAVGDPDLTPMADGDEVTDMAGGMPDTPRELTQGFDDNVVSANVRCRDLALLKEVRSLPNGTFVTGDMPLSIPAVGGAVQIEYRYTVTNTGETAEDVTLTDGSLCADAAGVPGVTFVNCPLCADPTPGELTASLAPAGMPGNTFQTTCSIQFATNAALRDFLMLDNGDPACSSNPMLGDPNDCYRNCADASASASPSGGLCSAPVIERDSFATICNRVCMLQVTKRARCILDSCQTPTQFGPFVNSMTDPLVVAQGSCVQYEVEIANNGMTPICRLRLDDLLSSAPADIALVNGSVRLEVNGMQCPMPACFNVLGNPCEIDPATCPAFPGGVFGAGQTAFVRFSATIPNNANPNPPDPINTIVVDGAADCPAGAPVYSCTDEDNVELDIRPASLQCNGKQWAFQQDTDADCDADPPFSAFASSVDLRDKVFPVVLNLRVQATNTGQIPLQVTASDAALTTCVNNVDGVSFIAAPACELGTAKLVEPGAMATWLCQIRIDSAEAARAMDACDGMNDNTYDNTATVSGVTVASASGICVQSVTVPGTGNCAAELLLPPPCAITVNKQVKCKTDPDTAYAAQTQALPGATSTYRIRLTNSGTVNLPQVCMTDTLSCGTWFVQNSVTADLAGSNANACVSNAFAAGVVGATRACYTFGTCRPAAPWLAPGETLTITFDVQTPANFATTGTAVDCMNSIVAQGYTENCIMNPPADDTFCGGTSSAQINVLVPDIECAQTVCVDLNSDGTCEQGPSTSINLPPSTTYPLSFTYKATITNNGETPLMNVRSCNPQLVERAIAAGLVFLGCDICDGACDNGPGDDCADLPPLAPGGSAMATCTLQVPTRAAWDAFATTDPDGSPICYRNGIGGQGSANTTGLCATGANTFVSTSTCDVNLCIPPPIPMGGCCLPNGDCEESTEVDCEAVGGIYNGDGSLCLGDGNNNGIDDLCEQPIPTVSEWGLVILGLLLLVAARLRFGRATVAIG